MLRTLRSGAGVSPGSPPPRCHDNKHDRADMSDRWALDSGETAPFRPTTRVQTDSDVCRVDGHAAEDRPSIQS